jgi:hypothetical protein
MTSAGAFPTYENTTLAYLNNAQASDGSFGGDDLYVTAKVLKALGTAPLAGAIGNPVVTGITASGTLQTGVSTTLQIAITNNGSSTVNSGVLQVVADNFSIASVDLAAQGISIAPSSTQQIALQLPNTMGLVGNVQFTAFIEGPGGIGYPRCNTASIP